ncbi:MAG: UDPGP type 1 family protein [Planctomycetota bacterium]|nr:UDPGP type 1 family protein [Planctomycetota bacterium]
MTIEKRLREVGQGHLADHLARLDNEERHRLVSQLERIDLESVERRVAMHLDSGVTAEELRFEPVDAIEVPREMQEQQRAEISREIGLEAIASGRLGLLMVAGGQATRLGISGPKGLVPIGPISGKNLFQWHAEKILALGKRVGRSLPWMVMTGPANDEETRQSFEAQGYFGMPKEDIFFFCQGTVPAVDLKGRMFLSSRDAVFENPDGHGGVLEALKCSGGFSWLEDRGVDQLFYFQVDNPLIRVGDPVFLGHHLQARAEMSSKVVEKFDSDEKVGVVGKLNGQTAVVEYSDLPEKFCRQTDDEGRLRFRHGNMAVHLFSCPFLVERGARVEESLPFHVAWKTIPHLDASGKMVQPEAPNGLKFERFVFDLLPHASSSVTMTVERNLEFSPVKNREGNDSQESARRDLVELFARWLESAGLDVPRNDQGAVRAPIEIAAGWGQDEQEVRARLVGDDEARERIRGLLEEGKPIFLE